MSLAPGGAFDHRRACLFQRQGPARGVEPIRLETKCGGTARKGDC